MPPCPAPPSLAGSRGRRAARSDLWRSGPAEAREGPMPDVAPVVCTLEADLRRGSVRGGHRGGNVGTESRDAKDAPARGRELTVTSRSARVKDRDARVSAGALDPLDRDTRPV